MEKKIKRIGVLTSGGDAPGMNAAIRSVVRKGVYEGLEVIGIFRGYEGLINNETTKLTARSVSNIISLGGTILKTARSKEFETKEGRTKAVKNIKENGIDAMVIIGGNGSFQGAHLLHTEFGIQNIGVPGTIDNDLGHTEYTVGCFTAVDTALDAVDKIRDTVSSMERIYVVEVMGRQEPYIAVMSGMAGGAEEILFPGMTIDYANMAAEIKAAREKGKKSWIIILSEGAGNAGEVCGKISEITGLEARAVVLGHIQRGGSPNALDRVLGTIMGARAVDAIIAGESDASVVSSGHGLSLVSYEKACFERGKDKKMHARFYSLTKLLAQ